MSNIDDSHKWIFYLHQNYTYVTQNSVLIVDSGEQYLSYA